MANDDLISRKALIETVERYKDKRYNSPIIESLITSVLCVINNALSVDAKPVRRGKWRIIDRNHAECSECKLNRNIGTQSEWEYCPKCGAKMFFVKEKDKWS